MNRDKVISDILHIPRDFHVLGNISINALLRERGYFDAHSLISVEDIKTALAAEPECVEEWLAYSLDKRCDSGWYFVQQENHKHVVGYYPLGDKSSLTYDDPLDACAAFIKNEIEDIRRCEQLNTER